MDDLTPRRDGPRVKCGTPGCHMVLGDVVPLEGAKVLAFRRTYTYPKVAREANDPAAVWTMDLDNVNDYRGQYAALAKHGEVRGNPPGWNRPPLLSGGEFASGGPTFPGLDRLRVPSLYPEPENEPGYTGWRRGVSCWVYGVRAFCPLCGAITRITWGDVEADEHPGPAIRRWWAKNNADVAPDDLETNLDGFWLPPFGRRI